MDQTTQSSQMAQMPEENIPKNLSPNDYNTEINIYPTLRRFLIILCIVLAIAILFFLIYENGKSIYANGL